MPLCGHKVHITEAKGFVTVDPVDDNCLLSEVVDLSPAATDDGNRNKSGRP
jgi:hypothetical protein